MAQAAAAHALRDVWTADELRAMSNEQQRALAEALPPAPSVDGGRGAAAVGGVGYSGKHRGPSSSVDIDDELSPLSPAF